MNTARAKTYTTGERRPPFQGAFGLAGGQAADRDHGGKRFHGGHEGARAVCRRPGWGLISPGPHQSDQKGVTA